MTTQTKTRITSQELTKKITDHIHELAQATDAARMSEAFQEYLDFSARFHHYSINNQWLIWMSKPDATHVAGFCRWKEMGRYVKKGEQGIPILAPVLKKVDEQDDKRELVGFRVVYVFDASQTDGEPLPEPPDWKSPEKHQELTERLFRYAEGQNIKITVRELPGDVQGVSKGGEIVISPEAGTKTLIHEIAHELMHQGGREILDPAIRELEAESVAYVVARHFGIEDLNSPIYTALWGGDSAEIIAHMYRIRSTATQIIKTID